VQIENPHKKAGISDMSTTSDPTQSSPTTEVRLEQLAKEYASLDALREPINNRMEQIKAEWRILLDYGPHEIAGLMVSIQRNARFDPAAFQAAYPVMQHQGFYKHTPDMSAIEQVLPPIELRRFQKEGAPKVVVK
jgi:hypothetical protein